MRTPQRLPRPPQPSSSWCSHSSTAWHCVRSDLKLILSTKCWKGIILVLSIYFWIVVYSFFKELKEGGAVNGQVKGMGAKAWVLFKFAPDLPKNFMQLNCMYDVWGMRIKSARLLDGQKIIPFVPDSRLLWQMLLVWKYERLDPSQLCFANINFGPSMYGSFVA